MSKSKKNAMNTPEPNMILLGQGEIKRNDIVGANYIGGVPTKPIRKQVKFRYEVYSVPVLNNFLVFERALTGCEASDNVFESIINALKDPEHNYCRFLSAHNYPQLLCALGDTRDNFIYLRGVELVLNGIEGLEHIKNATCCTCTYDIFYDVPEINHLLAHEKLIPHLPALLDRDGFLEANEGFRIIEDGKIYVEAINGACIIGDFDIDTLKVRVEELMGNGNI